MSYAEQDVKARMLAEQKVERRVCWKVCTVRWLLMPRC